MTKRSKSLQLIQGPNPAPQNQLKTVSPSSVAKFSDETRMTIAEAVVRGVIGDVSLNTTPTVEPEDGARTILLKIIARMPDKKIPALLRAAKKIDRKPI